MEEPLRISNEIPNGSLNLKDLCHSPHNQSYSRKFKHSLVEQYRQSTESMELFAIKHGLRSHTQLKQWIIKYNESNLKAYTPRKRDSKMSGRKTSFEERLTIDDYRRTHQT